MKKRLIKKGEQKGITLIAVVVSIAVLLVLAGVVLISMQKSGIIGKNNTMEKKNEEATLNKTEEDSQNTTEKYEEISTNEALGIVKDTYDTVAKTVEKNIKRFDSPIEIDSKLYSGELNHEIMQNLANKFTPMGYTEFLNLENIEYSNEKFYVEDGIGSSDPRYISHDYSIEKVSKDEIVAILKITRDDETEPVKKFEITLIKENNNWIITNYPYVV